MEALNCWQVSLIRLLRRQNMHDFFLRCCISIDWPCFITCVICDTTLKHFLSAIYNINNPYVYVLFSFTSNPGVFIPCTNSAHIKNMLIQIISWLRTLLVVGKWWSTRQVTLPRIKNKHQNQLKWFYFSCVTLLSSLCRGHAPDDVRITWRKKARFVRYIQFNNHKSNLFKYYFIH